MKPDARLDALVATALREKLPAPAPDATREALRHVLERSPQHRPARLWASATAVAAAVAVAVLAFVVTPWSGDAPERLPVAPVSTAAPEELLGTWTRTVRISDDPAAEGSWSVRLTPAGVLELEGPPGTGRVDGASYALRGEVLTTDAFVNGECPDAPAGSYRWTVTGDTLRLERSGEPCGFRLSVLAGTWNRAGP